MELVSKVRIKYPAKLEAVVEALRLLDVRHVYVKGNYLDLNPLMRRVCNGEFGAMELGDVAAYLLGKPRTLSHMKKYFGGQTFEIRLVGGGVGMGIAKCKFGEGDVLAVKHEVDGLEFVTLIPWEKLKLVHEGVVEVAAPV